MTRLISRAEIDAVLPTLDLTKIIEDGSVYVIKIASGFAGNAALGKSPAIKSLG